MTDRSIECPVCGAKPHQRCFDAMRSSLPWGQNHEARNDEILRQRFAAEIGNAELVVIDSETLIEEVQEALDRSEDIPPFAYHQDDDGNEEETTLD